MTSQTIFYIILSFFAWEFIFSKILDYLNTKNWSDKLPEELSGIYDEKKYEKSMQYEKAKYKFSSISSTFSFFIMLLVLVFWWFGFLSDFISSLTENYILRNLYFFGIITVIQTFISLPLSYYSTFVIEEKFGFNKMTKTLFFIDTIKSFILSIILGWIIFSLVVYIYLLFPDYFALFAWIFLTSLSIFMMMFYSSLIVPLFNKQTPLEDWDLRNAIEDFWKKVWFKLDNIFVIDWSKRSSKANAYFSGFWPKKRIVLYDTLIADLETEELIAVLAHEIGHYKKKHTLQMLSFSVIQTWFMLFIFSLALKISEVSQALGWTESNFWLAIVAFGILFTPISMIFWIIWNILSRKNEYEADAFAKQNYSWVKLSNALIKLSRNNLSNLRPHPAYEFFHYSHPTVLKRLKALKS